MELVEESTKASGDCEKREDSENDKAIELPKAGSIVESIPVAQPQEQTAKSSDNDTPVEGENEAKSSGQHHSESKDGGGSSSEKPSEEKIRTLEDVLRMERGDPLPSSSENTEQGKKDDVAGPEGKSKDEKIRSESDSELSSGEKLEEVKSVGSEHAEKPIEEKQLAESESEPSSSDKHEDVKSVGSEPAEKPNEEKQLAESESELSSSEKHEDSPKSVRFSEEVTEISSKECSHVLEDETDPENRLKEGAKSVRFAEEASEIVMSAVGSDDFHDTSNDVASFEDSEYETPEPDDDDLEKEDDDEESNASESGESSGGSQVLTEREDGDGQESEKKDKKLDHDEDKRDPQYIPKKGNFYEHDDRTSETDEVPPKKVPPQKPYETKERWNHDLYDDDLQSPKSRQELIDQYGYDIRQEEGPPKARRRRRYGRGPNKYTRSWEEMEAYTKSRGSWRGRGRGRPNPTPRNTEEDFPPLPSRKVSDRLQKRIEKKVEDQKEESEPTPVTPPPQKKEAPVQKKSEEIGTPQPPSVKKTFKQVYVEEQVIVPSSRGRGRGRGRLPPGAPFKSQAHHPHNHHHHQQHHSKQSTAEEDIATLSQHFSEAVINVDNKSIMPISQQPPTPQQQSRASSLPPTSTTTQSSSQAPTTHSVHSSQSHPHGSSDRMHEERETMIEKSESKSKRYSTQRQRSLPQGSPQVQQPPPQRYIQDQFFHQGMEPTTGVAAPPPPPPQFAQPPPPAPQFPPEVPMMAFIPPGGQFQPLYVPPPPYLPPAPLPVQAPPGRAELYQGASGITYYNTQTQVNRPVSTSRRVKLAIPIVPPPESSS